MPSTDDRVGFEDALGRRLPTDYWWFLETYGTGAIGGDLVVFSPSASQDPWQLVAGHKRFGDLLRLVNERRLGEVPFAIHPDPGGLLAWGGAEGGVMCMWLTTEVDPNRWPLVLRDSNRSEWFTHQGPLIRFLGDLLDCSIEISFLPLGSAPRRFDPAG